MLPAIILLVGSWVAWSFTGIQTIYGASFLIWIAAALAFVAPFFRPSFQKLPRTSVDIVTFVAVTAVTVGIHFYHLTDYPYQSIGEEVRDTGLEAERLIGGTKSPFDWGAYEAHGMLPALISVPFQKIYPNSIEAIRVPAALLATAEILSLWLILFACRGSLSATIAAAILLCSPIHLAFARGQIVVLASSLFTTIICSTFLIKSALHRSALTGFLIGISMWLHASARPVAAVAGIVLLASGISWPIIIRFGVGFLVGAGPRLASFTAATLFDSKRILGWSSSSSNPLLGVLLRYWQTWVDFVTTPTGSVYRGAPLFGIWLLLLLAVSTALLPLRKKSPLTFLLLILLTIVPFCNSAITNDLNLSHRLLPMIPITALTIALALSPSSSSHHKLVTMIKAGICVFVFVIGAIQTKNFFTEKAMNTSMFRNSNSYQDFLARGIAEVARDRTSACVVVAPQDKDFFKLLHVQQSFKYFSPNTTFKFVESGAKDSQFFSRNAAIFQNCDEYKINTLKAVMTGCSVIGDWTCPDDNMPWRVFLEKP